MSKENKEKYKRGGSVFKGVSQKELNEWLKPKTSKVKLETSNVKPDKVEPSNKRGGSVFRGVSQEDLNKWLYNT